MTGAPAAPVVPPSLVRGLMGRWRRRTGQARFESRKQSVFRAIMTNWLRRTEIPGIARRSEIEVEGATSMLAP